MTDTVKITKPQMFALLAFTGTTYDKGISAAEFARRMWPDHRMHMKTSNQGNGATRGKAAWLCGGSYIAKLVKKGWVRRWDTQYSITEEGRKVIEPYKILKEIVEKQMDEIFQNVKPPYHEQVR